MPKLVLERLRFEDSVGPESLEHGFSPPGTRLRVESGVAHEAAYGEDLDASGGRREQWVEPASGSLPRTSTTVW